MCNYGLAIVLLGKTAVVTHYLSFGNESYSSKSYGKSNEESSFLYDPLYTMRTTINGQLLLTMLIEDILLNTSALLLQGNTDGATVYIKRSELDLCLELCKK